MITLPDTLTPVPRCPGYFWDGTLDKLFSIKVGGELRELRLMTVHPAAMRYKSWGKWTVGDRYYRLSVNGRTRYWTRAELRKLPLVDYAIPVIERTQDENS